jgi:hypothetical protein
MPVRDKFPIRPFALPGRSCGACSACCLLGVKELGKPLWEHCPHEVPGGGCDIYGKHPEGCRQYHCLYLAGVLEGGEELRPDRLGVIFDKREIIEGQQGLIYCWELSPGASERPDVVRLIERINERFPVIIRLHRSNQHVGSQKGERRLLPLVLVERTG